MNENTNPVGNPRVGEPHVAAQDDPVRVDDSEFGRFEALTGKLLDVPKKELDAKLKDENA